MKSRTMPLLLAAALVLLVSACASPQPQPEAQEKAPPRQTTEPDEPVEIKPAVRQALVERGEQDLKRMADRIKAYYRSAQKNCHGVDDCDHPWHDDPSTSAGMPMYIRDYVFPGGTDQHLTTMPEVPEGGELLPLEVEAAQFPEATMDKLIPTEQLREERSPFRITYTTTGKSGMEAEAWLKAEADFDPSTPEHHTLTQRIYIDPQNNSVQVEPAVIHHEYH